MSEREVAVLGVGMHPWGKWGRNFVEYGVKAARDALADAGLEWKDVQFVAGGDTIRNGYPGYVAGGDLRAGPRLERRAGGELLRRLRDRRAGGRARRARRSWRGSATSPSSSAPTRRRRASSRRPAAASAARTRTGCASGCSARRTRSTSASTRAAAWTSSARRRTTSREVKVKNSRHGLANPNARYRKLYTKEEVLGSAIVSDPLRLLEICATSDGGAALVLSSVEYARKRKADFVRIAAVSTVTPRYPNVGDRDAELRDRRRRRHGRGRARTSRSATRSRRGPTSRPASAPRTSRSPRSTTSRPRSSSTGTRTSASASPARRRSCSARATPPSAAGSP